MKYRLIQKVDADAVTYWFTQQYSVNFDDWSIVPGTLRLNRQEAERLYQNCIEGVRWEEGVVLKETDTAAKGSSVLTTDTCCARCGKRIVLAGALDPCAQHICLICSTPDSPRIGE